MSVSVWIIIGHLTFGRGPGSDVSAHYGHAAFATHANCEAWRATMGTELKTECKELVVVKRAP